MTDEIVPQVRPDSAALSAEHYQTFEMAKEHDGILGGNDIAQIRSYAAYARAQAQALHKTIAATSGIDDVAAIKAEATETAQTFAKVGIYADQRIGEILRELPKATNQHDAQQVVGTPTSTRQAERAAHIDHHTSIDLQAMAANPDVVQAVLDKAEAEGRIASRKQVLDAIHERDAARAEVATVRKVGDKLKSDLDDARAEIEALERQNDELYEQASAAEKPQVIERTVEVSSEADRRRIETLEHLERLHSDDNAKLRRKLEETRRELDRAKDLLGMDKTMQDVRRDVQYLISATNQYVRHYGGLTWTAASLEQVDAPTREELKKAATNLATFATALVASLESING